MMIQLRHAVLAGMMLGMAGNASAATQIFSGVDNGAAPGGNTPNASIAQAAFLAAAAAKGPVFTNYLDDEPLGNLQSYHIAGGLQVDLSDGSYNPLNTAQGIRNDSANGNPSNPFSTTEGPNDQGKWMGIPIYDTSFTFDVPTWSFGFYATGLDIAAGALFTLRFDDAPQVPENFYNLPVNANGGIMYWGAVFDAPVHKVEFFRSRNQSIDTFGIDGISFNVAPPPPPPPVGGVPEPASWAMLIGGFGLTGATMRRRRAVLSA
jgi:hypothetical protein